MVGNQVLNILKNLTKLGERSKGPYEIYRIHVNRTVTIIRQEGIHERINICKIMPFYENEQK